MTRINDFEFSIAMKIAANRCLAADVEEFLAIDTDETVVDSNVEKRVVRKLRFDEWKDVRRISAKTLKYAIIALVSAVSLFFGVTMSIQPVRAAFFGAIVTWYEDHIDVRFGSDTSDMSDDVDFVIMKPSYFPPSFDVVFDNIGQADYLCEYSNGDNSNMTYSQALDAENGVGIDDTIVDAEIIYLNDSIEANLFINENGDLTLIWKDKYLFTLLCRNISLEELIKVAESIK